MTRKTHGNPTSLSLGYWEKSAKIILPASFIFLLTTCSILGTQGLDSLLVTQNAQCPETSTLTPSLPESSQSSRSTGSSITSLGHLGYSLLSERLNGSTCTLSGIKSVASPGHPLSPPRLSTLPTISVQKKSCTSHQATRRAGRYLPPCRK